MIKIENLSFCYPTREEHALKNINIHIKEGEFVVLTGVSGCGKTTLLKALNGIIPHESSGKLCGEVWIDGLDTKENSISTLSQKIGLVFQNPDEQIFSTRVLEEIAFGMENLCYPREEIIQRIDWALNKVGMSDYKDSSTSALSGGQKQRIALASVMALKPKILVLDEPISQLDPKGAKEVLRVIKKLRDEGMTILMVEHRLHEVAKWADKIVIMDKGKIKLETDCDKIYNNLNIFKKLGLRTPMEKQIDFTKDFGEIDRNNISNINNERKLINIKDLWFSYNYKKRRKNNEWILKGIDLDIYEGEILGILGHNGSGKSTLMYHMAGIFKPQKGEVLVHNKNTKKNSPFNLSGIIGIVFQNPALMLTCDSVYEEIAFGPKNLKFPQCKIEETVEDNLNIMELSYYRNFHPQTLSGGQRLRCAVASIMSMKPKIILLDEPTSGQDFHHIKKLMESCVELKKQGTTIIFITHDFEVAAKYSDRLIFMNKGTIERQMMRKEFSKV
jgi:energy-coupling factor transport system ATP-binding protein